MPLFRPKGDGFTVRWKWANSHPDTPASSAASTKAVTFRRKVLTPIASAMVVPPFTARSARPVRESSRRMAPNAASSTSSQSRK